jgi:hypothetical protein
MSKCKVLLNSQFFFQDPFIIGKGLQKYALKTGDMVVLRNHFRILSKIAVKTNQN